MKISERQQYIDVAGRTVLITNRQKVNNNSLWIYHGYQVDRDGNRIGEWRLWKSDGRDWVGAMSYNLIREANVGMKLSEPATVILERLIEACETDIAMPGRTGPKQFGNAMPSSAFGSIDVWILEVSELFENNGSHTYNRNIAISDADVRRAKCSPQRISRMEEAFSWLGKYVFDHEMRRVLIAYATCKANGWDWDEVIQRRNRKTSSEKAWVKRTIYRWIGKSLHEVATKLCNDAIILRDGAGLQVAHEAAKPSCKSISSDLCERREDDSNRQQPMLSPAHAA
ncbi:hypothetical protein [Rhizobium sp. 21-4511-3d]